MGGDVEAFPLRGSLRGPRLVAAARTHHSWLSPRAETAAYWVFAAYATAVILLGRGQDAVWAAWAVPAYGVAAVMLPRSRTWGIALVTAAFAVGAPLLIMLAQGDLATGMAVIERSATLLVKSGTPYLPHGQLSSWLSYDPYLPVMALFGLPSAAGLQGAPGDPNVWLVLATVGVLAAALRTLVPHSVVRCVECRHDLVRATAFAVACPVLALNLAVTTTDPPVLALMVLSLSLLSFPERTVAAAAALGLACAMKPTAWLAIPVLAAMLRVRDGNRAAVVFFGTSFAFIVAAAIPALISDPVAAVQNTVLFPLGLTSHLTPAQSLTPGDLLARVGPSGHAAAVALLLLAGLAVAVSLVVRPPRTLRAATWRLAVGLTLMFALGPDERFGYFIYPLGLVGWLWLTSNQAAAAARAGAAAGAAARGEVAAGAGVAGRQTPTLEGGT